MVTPLVDNEAINAPLNEENFSAAVNDDEVFVPGISFTFEKELENENFNGPMNNGVEACNSVLKRKKKFFLG
ncbi:hypothetical protein Hanom_Chr17g01568691 [Helianthus anomalus]